MDLVDAPPDVVVSDDRPGLAGCAQAKCNRRQKRDDRARQAKQARTEALEDAGLKRERIKVKVTEWEFWRFPLQPHPRTGYGGQGLARESLWLAMGADRPGFMEDWTAVFNEHVNWGKRGNAFGKAVKRERDANMLWRQRLREKITADGMPETAGDGLELTAQQQQPAPRLPQGKAKDKQSRARLDANEARSLVKRSKSTVDVSAQQQAIEVR